MKEDCMNETPFIHLFQTSEGYYFYDVNKDKILQIPEEVYKVLTHNTDGKSEMDKPAYFYIEKLKKAGYLKTNRASVSEHPMTEILEYYLQNKMSHIILQITQNCNLRCEYCIYSGGYNNRPHTNKTMSFDTAKRAIDYLIKHSRDSNRIGYSFYGGEPLLAFGLIKKCVLYAEQQAEGRTVDFNFTTNGTLLTKDKIDFLQEHNFNMLISLDGPKIIHDKHRKFAGSKEGSFETILNNITYIHKEYPDFYYNRVSFNTVLDSNNSFTEVNEFLSGNSIFEKVRLNSALISGDYVKVEVPSGKAFSAELKYELFKLYLSKTGWLLQTDTSKLLENQFRNMKQLAVRLKKDSQTHIPDKCHRGGTCIPGGQKLFVNADGNLYPCERVSESSKASLLGNIYEGIDINKAKELLNLEKETAKACHNCWAYYYCKICITKADDGDKISADLIKQSCSKVKTDLENNFKDFCVLNEFGYDPEADRKD
jgi:uncharacterized protein